MGKPIPVFADPQVVIDYVGYHGRITRSMRNYFNVTLHLEGLRRRADADVYTQAVVCNRVTKLVLGLLPFCHTTSVCMFLFNILRRYSNYLTAETARVLFASLFWAIEFEDKICEDAVCEFYSRFERYLFAPCFLPFDEHHYADMWLVNCSPSLFAGLTSRGFKLCLECSHHIVNIQREYRTCCAQKGVTDRKTVKCTDNAQVMFGEFVGISDGLQRHGVHYNHRREVGMTALALLCDPFSV